MNADRWTGLLPVLLVAAAVCLTPALTSPTLQFGVRVPHTRTEADVIVDQRHRYYARTLLLAVGSVLVALFVGDPAWIAAALLPAQLVAGVGCYLLARRRVAAVKAAERWFDGVPQRVATDTRWRTEPERFPVAWAVPSVALVVATAVLGAVRYPRLPARIPVHFSLSGHADGWAGTTVWTAFGPVLAQLVCTVVIVGLLALVHRSRPDVDAADVAGSTRRYRVFLTRTGRVMLLLAVLADAALLVTALQVWQVWQPSGTGSLLVALLPVAGALGLVVTAVRMGQSGSRLPAASAPGGSGAEVRSDGGPQGVDNRDDDRFWKAGLFYVNRDDPALLVPKRFGVGWTINVGNPKSWVLVAVLVALLVGPTIAASVPGR